jgi:MerR family transcriptional regulator, thiopeptide resistance regulator
VEARVAGKWTVSEVARLARVSVRTLHHYDEIGLLPPSARSGKGYRLYAPGDLERLHQILLYRELDFPLEAIRNLLDGPAIDRHGALKAQRELLLARRRRTAAVIRAVNRALESMERGTTMSTEEMFEGFEELGDAPDDVRAHHAEHAQETHEQWGDTDAYKESMKRAKGYSKKDWEAMKGEIGEAEAHMARLLADGTEPDELEAMQGAEALRQQITRWFYPCSREMHAGLADMYEADPRFAAYYEERAKGLSTFVARAIRANAKRS